MNLDDARMWLWPVQSIATIMTVKESLVRSQKPEARSQEPGKR
jgi:hypothetical protein